MSTKGKEKEVDNVPTVVIDDDEEATNFFVKKKKRRVIASYSPVRSPSPVHILDDSDDEDGRARAKKPKAKPKKPVSIVPAWARTNSSHSDGRKKSRSVGRASTEERRGRHDPSETIVIESSPEKDATGGRKEVELTPPPELLESTKAEIAQAIQSSIALKPRSGIATIPTEDTNDRNADLPSTSALNDTVRAVFRMVAAPERKQDAPSAKAAVQYEKKRTITMSRGQPLEYAVATLAKQARIAEEIIVTYNGDRIYSTLLTPQTLGIEYDAEFVCYEKPFYHRLESEAKDTRRQAELRKEEEQVEEEDDQDDGNESQSSEAPIEITDKVKINLMGPFGLISATVQPHVTAGSLCKYYLKKTDNDKALLDSLRINLDGEMLGPDTTVEDMDVDAGDQIDVVQI